MKAVSYSRWSLNAGSINLVEENLLYQNSGPLMQAVSNTSLTVFPSFINFKSECFSKLLFISFNCYPKRHCNCSLDPSSYNLLFRLLQIESICRRQNKYDSKIEICFGISGEHCGKRRKCCLPSFSPFSQCFQTLYYSGSLKVGIAWYRVERTREKVFEK